MVLVNITFNREKLQKQNITNEQLEVLLSEYTNKVYNKNLLFKFKVVSIYIEENKIEELRNNPLIKDVALNGEKRAI